MAPVLICRYEGPKGEGPFSSQSGIKWNLLTTHLNDPYRDGIRKFSQDHFFGFLSEREAHYWFNPYYRDLMAAHDIHLVWYMVPPSCVLWGEHQVAFVRDNSLRVDPISIH